MRIWVFYNRQGEWGLRLNGKYTICKTLDVRIPLRGRMRAGASPNAYLTGVGRVEWSADKQHARLMPSELPTEGRLERGRVEHVQPQRSRFA